VTTSDRGAPQPNTVSIFPYPGGKGRESDWIIDKIPPHRTYVEVFGGSAALLYNKPPSRNEVYNDVNDDLVQFFRVLRERPDELVEWLRAVPYARSTYERWVTAYFSGQRPDDPIARAGRFFALRYMQFAGDISMKSGFKTRAIRSPARTFNNAREQLREVADRFADVVIECNDWREVLQIYDDPRTVFYLDPPYLGSEHYYGVEFDHAALADALADLNGNWLISYADLPETLEGEVVLARNRRHRMCRAASDATEHLVCSFDPSVEPAAFHSDDPSTAQARLGAVPGTSDGHGGTVDQEGSR
jgi:DNA adenine methylase